MIRFIKLITGDEFIGDIEEGKIKNAVKLMPHGEGMAFVPFPVFRHKDEVLEIDEENVIFQTSVPTDLENEYKKQFGGIITAGKSLIGI